MAVLTPRGPEADALPLKLTAVHAVRGRETNLIDTEATIDQIVAQDKTSETGLLLSYQQGKVRTEVVVRLDSRLAAQLREGQVVQFDPGVQGQPRFSSTDFKEPRAYTLPIDNAPEAESN